MMSSWHMGEELILWNQWFLFKKNKSLGASKEVNERIKANKRMLVVIFECLQTLLTGIFMNTNPHVYPPLFYPISPLSLFLSLYAIFTAPYMHNVYTTYISASLKYTHIYIFKCTSMHIQIPILNKHQCKVTSFKTLIIYCLMLNNLHSSFVKNDLMDHGSVSILKTHHWFDLTHLFTLDQYALHINVYIY